MVKFQVLKAASTKVACQPITGFLTTVSSSDCTIVSKDMISEKWLEGVSKGAITT
jgi:hypothetical protein